MAVLSLSNIAKHYAGYDILKDISFAVERDHRIGLIGKNGSGKTTLFKLIKGDISPDSGQIFIPKKINVSFLHQEAEFTENQSLIDFVLSGATEYLSLKKQLKMAEEAISKNHSIENTKKLNDIQTKFDAIEGYSFEQKMHTILYSLHFPKEVWKQDLSLFSGGEKTRLQLAKNLIQPFDLLLLDEPTNHLDIAMIYWLENYLTSLDKPYIIISHDRKFLDKTVNRIYEIMNKNIYSFKGNYSQFLKQQEERNQLLEKQFKQQQKKIKKEEDFIRRNMAGQKVQQAKSRQKQLQKMNIIDSPEIDRSINLNFEITARSGNKVFEFIDAEFGWTEQPLFSGFSEIIEFRDKVAILGKNGCGKSTLLKIINQELQLNSGKFKLGSSVTLGYYDQFHISLDETLTVTETIWQLNPSMTKGEVYSYLAKYEFYEEDWLKKVVSLSGGERARLYLAKLIWEKPNVLVLDEPTNHLDLLTIDSLEKALIDYEGTILFVSHDRTFIENVANRYFLFENGKISESKKNLSEIFDESLISKKPKSKVRKSAIKKNKEKRVNPFIIKKIEEKITENELDRNRLISDIELFEMEYSKPEVLSDRKKMDELVTKIKQRKSELDAIEKELDKLENEYLELIED